LQHCLCLLTPEEFAEGGVVGFPAKQEILNVHAYMAME